MCLALGMRFASVATKTRKRLREWIDVPAKLYKIKQKANEIVKRANVNPTKNYGALRADLVRIVHYSMFKRKFTIQIWRVRHSLLICM